MGAYFFLSICLPDAGRKPPNVVLCPCSHGCFSPLFVSVSIVGSRCPGLSNREQSPALPSSPIRPRRVMGFSSSKRLMVLSRLCLRHTENTFAKYVRSVARCPSVAEPYRSLSFVHFRSNMYGIFLSTLSFTHFIIIKGEWKSTIHIQNKSFNLHKSQINSLDTTQTAQARKNASTLIHREVMSPNEISKSETIRREAPTIS